MDVKNNNSAGNLAPHKLVMLITVVQKGKGTFFADFIKTFDANLQIAIVGTGTADANLVEFLGLKDNKRSIIFSIAREEKVNAIMEALPLSISAGRGGSPARSMSLFIYGRQAVYNCDRTMHAGGRNLWI